MGSAAMRLLVYTPSSPMPLLSYAPSSPMPLLSYSPSSPMLSFLGTHGRVHSVCSFYSTGPGWIPSGDTCLLTEPDECSGMSLDSFGNNHRLNFGLL